MFVLVLGEAAHVLRFPRHQETAGLVGVLVFHPVSGYQLKTLQREQQGSDWTSFDTKFGGERLNRAAAVLESVEQTQLHGDEDRLGLQVCGHNSVDSRRLLLLRLERGPR